MESKLVWLDCNPKIIFECIYAEDEILKKYNKWNFIL